jgi:hypothetical protein
VIGLNRFPWRVPPKCRSMCYAVIYILENVLMKSNDNTFNACDLSLSLILINDAMVTYLGCFELNMLS